MGERLRRPAWIALKVAVAVAVAAGSVAVGRLVEAHLKTSPAFEIKRISIEGADRLDRESLLRAGGLAMGQNVFAVSPADVKARLGRLPWVAEAEVRRQLPDTFEVRIRERLPAAAVALREALYLVSQEGVVFKRVEPSDPIDLPVITGIDRQRFIRDRQWRASVLVEVVALLHDYGTTGLSEQRSIQEVHLEPDDGLTLYLGDEATLVRLGRGPYRRKLGKLRAVLERLERREAKPAYVYLDNVRRPDRVTVKLR